MDPIGAPVRTGSMASADTLELLHRSISMAGTGDEPWSHCIERIAAVTGHSLGLFYHEQLGQNRTLLTDVVEGHPELTRRFEERYQHLNPYLRGSRLRDARAGMLGSINSILPFEEVESTEFYREFVLPQELDLEQSLFLIAAVDRSVMHCIALCRRRGRTGPTPSEACRVIAPLMPSLRTAVLLHSRTAALEVDLASVCDVLDMLPQGVVLLDARGRPRVINEQARALAARHDGLQITPSGLRTSCTGETRALRRLVVDAAAGGGRAGSLAGGVLRVFRPSLQPPYELLVRTLPRGRGAPSAHEPVVAVFITNPDEPRPPLRDVFRMLYGLSTAQAEVAMAIAGGASLVATAAQLGIARETAKSHLKSVFLKTDTSSQSQLVRLVLSGPAGLGDVCAAMRSSHQAMR